MIYIGENEQNELHRSGHAKAHELLQYALKKNYNMEQNQMVFASGQYGKPYLHEFPKIQFNLSHCREMAVCAIGNLEVGIDIEGVRPYSEGIIKKVLTEQEKEELEYSDNKNETFFRFWTLKESFIKAIGKGFTFPIQKIEFKLPSLYGVQIVSSNKDYTFMQWRIKPKDDRSDFPKSFIVSLCVAGNNITNEYNKIENINGEFKLF